MDNLEILKATESTKRLVQDEQYYKYIFKKTERIVSVVFYIIHNLPSDKKSVSHVEDIQHTARQTHDAMLQTLQLRAHVAEEQIRDAAHSLITLESKLRVAHVSHLFAADVMQVLSNEIDTVLRGLGKYLNGPDDILLGDTSQTPPPRPTAQRRRTAPVNSAVPTASVTTPTPQIQTDRRTRITTVLETRGEASIKDIATVVSDVSEKTIQRELNAMIEDNVVKRLGERRWSTYKLM